MFLRMRTSLNRKFRLCTCVLKTLSNNFTCQVENYADRGDIDLLSPMRKVY